MLLIVTVFSTKYQVRLTHREWCTSENYYFLSKWFKPIIEHKSLEQVYHLGNVIDFFFQNCKQKKTQQVHNSCTENSFNDLAKYMDTFPWLGFFFAREIFALRIDDRSTDSRIVDNIKYICSCIWNAPKFLWNFLLFLYCRNLQRRFKYIRSEGQRLANA